MRNEESGKKKKTLTPTKERVQTNEHGEKGGRGGLKTGVTDRQQVSSSSSREHHVRV